MSESISEQGKQNREGISVPEKELTPEEESARLVQQEKEAQKVHDLHEETEEDHQKDKEGADSVLEEWPPDKLSPEVEAALGKELEGLGMSLEDLSDKEKVEMAEELGLQVKEEKVEEKDVKRGYLKAIDQIQKDKTLSNSEKIHRIIEEYGEKEELAEHMKVLKQYQALLNAPEIGEQDRAVMGQMFESAPLNLSTGGFEHFVYAVYENEAVTQEAKDVIEEKFKIPQKLIYTGRELNQTLEMETPEGEPAYTKEEPFRLRSGVDAYINEQGEKVIRVPGRDAELPILVIDGKEDEGALRTANFAIMYQVMYEELERRPELIFGGEAGQYKVLTPTEGTIKRAETIAQALLPEFSETRILSAQDQYYLRQSFQAMSNYKSLGEGEIQEDLEGLGVISGVGDLNEERLHMIGHILKFNDYFSAAEQDEFQAYSFLQRELARRLGKEDAEMVDNPAYVDVKRKSNPDELARDARVKIEKAEIDFQSEVLPGAVASSAQIVEQVQRQYAEGKDFTHSQLRDELWPVYLGWVRAEGQESAFNRGETVDELEADDTAFGDWLRQVMKLEEKDIQELQVQKESATEGDDAVL